jgi:hypothetical protein
MIRPTRLSAALIFLACLSLAACNSSDSSVSSTSSPSTVPSGITSTSNGTSTTSGYTISGVVSGTTGVSMTLAGTAATTTTTDSSGNFSFATLAAGNYTVSPSKTGYVFSPVSRAATVSSASLSNLTFAATATTAATYTISGTVVGSAVAGVVITLNGSNVGSVVTDLSGNYTFSGLVSGTYTVTASLDGYSFTSPLIVSLGNVDSASNNFTSTAAATGNLAFTAVSTLPQATVGSPYSNSVIKSISGGTAPYHYESDTLAAGAPPLGMIVNPSGNLTGTPTVPGQYDFSICATDSTDETSPCEATSITVVAAQTSQPTPPSATPTVALAASPSSIAAGGSSVLTWSSKNATSCDASGGWTGIKGESGSFTVDPTSTTTYTLTCSGPSGSDHASTLITVRAATPAPAAPTVTLAASETTIPTGSTTTLNWSSKNATSCVGSGGWSGTETTSGTHNISPTITTTYTLACTSAAGTVATSTKVTVDAAAPVPAPTVTLTASSTTISSGGSSTLTWSTTNATSCTASGGWSGTETTSGTHSVSPTTTTTYTLACKGTGTTTQASDTVTVNATQTPTAPASGTSWVYYNGVFDWPGDYSYVATPDYSDTSGGPLSGAHDIKITLQGAYGGWLPYAQNWSFNSAGYTKLTFALKPTVANQSWEVFFVKVGDVPVGIYVDPTKYGPKPVAGQWATYTIPLADLGVLGTTIYKFGIADQTGLGNNVWYVDNVGFAP